MHFISLDTNTWIYLANGTEPVAHLDFIRQEVEKKNLTVLIPQVVKEEWEKHKHGTVQIGAMKQFKDVLESLEKISKLLGAKGKEPVWSFLIDTEKEEDYFEDLREKIKSKKSKVEEAIDENINLVDHILSHPTNIIIPITDEVILEASTLAMEKKAPFKMKNSFADAVIVLSFLSYVKEKKISEAKFVSYNTDDFCQQKNNKKTLHPDLEPYFKEAGSFYFKNVGEVLNTIEKDIVSQETLALIEQRQEEYNGEYICEECDGYHGFGNEVDFYKSEDVFDTRVEINLDPNQLYLFKEVEHQASYIDLPVTKLGIGSCRHCSTLYVECPECNAVTLIPEFYKETRVECSGECGIAFVIENTFDETHSRQIFFTIIDNRLKKCENCDNEFLDIDGLSLCQVCEDEYAYGNK